MDGGCWMLDVGCWIITRLQMLAVGRWLLGCLAAWLRRSGYARLTLFCTVYSVHTCGLLSSHPILHTLLGMESMYGVLGTSYLRRPALPSNLLCSPAPATIGSAEKNHHRRHIIGYASRFDGRKKMLAVIRASECRYVELYGKHVSVPVPTP